MLRNRTGHRDIGKTSLLRRTATQQLSPLHGAVLAGALLNLFTKT